MTKPTHVRRSELFLVRMWTDPTDRGNRLTHGKVQRAVSGETSRFDNWQGLLDRLRSMVADDADDADDNEGQASDPTLATWAGGRM